MPFLFLFLLFYFLLLHFFLFFSTYLWLCLSLCQSLSFWYRKVRNFHNCVWGGTTEITTVERPWIMYNSISSLLMMPLEDTQVCTHTHTYIQSNYLDCVLKLHCCVHRMYNLTYAQYNTNACSYSCRWWDSETNYSAGQRHSSHNSGRYII